MKILVRDRRETIGFRYDENKNPILNPENWIECDSDEIDNIPFIHQWRTEGTTKFPTVELKDPRLEDNPGMIIAYTEDRTHKWVIGYWKK